MTTSQKTQKKNELKIDALNAETPNSSLFGAIVEILKMYNIYSLEAMRKSPLKNMYYEYISHNLRRKTLVTAIEVARSDMAADKTFADFIPDEVPHDNNVFKDILVMNRIDVDEFCINLYKWAAHKSGKKGCLLLQGPADTGKSMLAFALAACVPYYTVPNRGEVDPRFTFSSCTGSPLILQDEGGLTPSTIEDFKVITSRLPLFVESKGKNEKSLISPTCYLWTTNADRPFDVANGNCTDSSHYRALESRIYQYKFDFVLDQFQRPSQEILVKDAADLIRYGKSKYEEKCPGAPI